MKKYVIIGLIIMLTIASSVTAISNLNNEELFKIKNSQQKSSCSIKTVFAEECTASWCPSCPDAAEALYNIYKSGNYSFYYVTLVDDMNPIANNRNRDYAIGIFKIYAFPTVYFDGGYIHSIGRGINVEETETEYRAIIEEVAQRPIKHEINIQSSVKWEGDAKLTVTINITNQGNYCYLGKIRSYVTEIISRWIDYNLEPYHFAFLDYALNKIIFLKPGESKTLTGIFDGKSDHEGNTYSDITSDNIMVISTVSNFVPHYQIGYQGENLIQRYFAFYIDQTSAATPTG